MGGEELKWRQLAHIQLMSQQGSNFSPHLVQLKPMIKAQFSGRMVSRSDVAFASVYSKKTRLKKLMMMKMIIIIIIMNKSQETTAFSRHQKLTSAMKLRPEK